jgi:hypothetical protein
MIVGIDIGPTLQGVAYIYAGVLFMLGLIYALKR